MVTNSPMKNWRAAKLEAERATAAAKGAKPGNFTKKAKFAIDISDNEDVTLMIIGSSGEVLAQKRVPRNELQDLIDMGEYIIKTFAGEGTPNA